MTMVHSIAQRTCSSERHTNETESNFSDYNGAMGRFEKMSNFLRDESSGGDPRQPIEALRAAVIGAGVLAGTSSPALGTQPTGAVPRAEEAIRATGQLALDSLVADITESGADTSTDTISGAELACLEKNIYHEARGEIDEGQLAIAFVTIARAMSKKFPASICGVVYQNKQFSWTFDRKILAPRPIDGKRAAHIRDLLKEMVAGQRLADAATLLGMVLDLPSDTLFYKRTDWDETKMSKQTAAMFARLKPIKTIGNHTFYAEPRSH